MMQPIENNCFAVVWKQMRDKIEYEQRVIAEDSVWGKLAFISDVEEAIVGELDDDLYYFG